MDIRKEHRLPPESELGMFLTVILPRRCECLVPAMVIRKENRPPPESELGMFLTVILPRRCECLVSAMVIRKEHRLPPESELGMFLTDFPRCEGYPKGKHALWVYEGFYYFRSSELIAFGC
jgi:hypothetical protein